MKARWRLLLGVRRGRRGRVLPMLLLLAGTLLLARIDDTPLAALRETTFDMLQQWRPRAREAEPVIVVGIDSKSLVRHGQWPWPRDLLAELVDKIGEGHPLALGIDVIFAEPDRYSPATLRARLPRLGGDIPDPDRRLAEALRGLPTVLAIAGFPRQLPGSRLPLKPLPARALAGDQTDRLRRFAAALPSLPEIERGATGEGLINVGRGHGVEDSEAGVLRKLPTLAYVGERPFLSLPLEMVRVALQDAGLVALEADVTGISAIRIGDYRLPTAPDGELLLHYGRRNANYYLSAADVLAGRYAPEVFRSRFVILGFTATGLQDRIATPLGDSLPGVDAHVQVIESLLAGEALRRPAWMPGLEIAVLLAAGLLLIAALPRLRADYASLAFAGTAAALLGATMLAFASGRFLFDGVSIAALLSPAFIALLGNTLAAADVRRLAAEGQLRRSREAAARIAGELGAARRIQMGLLPDIPTLLADERRVSVGALLEPAQAVGGDYYECCMLDDHRLCIAVGDVSGKGVPASLFMAISKTLTGTLTRRHDDLGEALRDIERELFRHNREYLFVTAFIGILDLATGWLDFVCAGHDAPLLRRDGKWMDIEIAAVSGPPLCTADAYPFAAARTHLRPGDDLCLFTDGATEASDGTSFFGKERLIAALGDLPEDRTQAVKALRDAIRRFEAGHPPVDDLTLMLLRWNGPPACR